MVKIIIDTREKTPWTFEGQKGITTERATLKSGDYSIEGFEQRVAVERKSLDDWIGSVMRERARFYRELERLRAFDFRCVIIEASTRDLHSSRVKARVSPASIMGFVADVSVSQCVPVYLAGDRGQAQVLAGALLKACEKRFQKEGESTTLF